MKKEALLALIIFTFVGLLFILKPWKADETEEANNRIVMVVSSAERVDYIWDRMKQQRLSRPLDYFTIKNEETNQEATLIEGFAQERVLFGERGCPFVFHVCSNGVFVSRDVTIGEGGHGDIPASRERLDAALLDSISTASKTTDDGAIPMGTNNTVQIVLYSGARVSSLFDTVSLLEKKGYLFWFVSFVPDGSDAPK